jgi:hypothetical protein
MMRNKRSDQSDLFENRMATTALLPEIRIKLSPLLRTLLSEAAGVGWTVARTDTTGQGSGDDEDHA